MPSHKSPRHTSVYIVDDHTFSRHAVSMLINAQRDMFVCGDSASAEIALREIAQREPEVAVVDLILDGTYGTELIGRVRTRVPRCRVLVLSVCDEHDHAREAFQCGACGYVTKNGAAPQRLLAAIRGSGPISGMAHRGFAERGRRGLLDHLTAREHAIMRLTGLGASATSIACQLHMPEKALRACQTRIRHLLHLGNGSRFVDFCVRQLRPPAPELVALPRGAADGASVGAYLS